jgi:broad specificity phosphatase PhoE
VSERGFPYCLIVLRHGQSEWNAAVRNQGRAAPARAGRDTGPI